MGYPIRRMGQFQKMAINSDGPSGWMTYTPSDPVNPEWLGTWNPAGWGDHTRILTWDISNYDATGATWMQIIFSQNMGGVINPGNFYIDNVRLIGNDTTYNALGYLEEDSVVEIIEDVEDSLCADYIQTIATESSVEITAVDAMRPEVRSDRLIVGLADDVDLQKAIQMVEARGGSIINQFHTINAIVVDLPGTDTDPITAATDWITVPGVLYAEPSYRVYALDAIPNDPLFDSLWGMDNTGQTGGAPDADIDAPEAWDEYTGSGTVVLASIDTGVDYNHEDLNMWINPGEIPGNGIDDDGNGYIDDIYGIDTVNNDSDPMDDHGHGTHTSGTMAGIGNNGIGVAGITWDAQIMALKWIDTSGYGTSEDVIECLDYMTMMKTTYGVNVVVSNNSWWQYPSEALEEAIEASINAGIMFVTSAGNNNNDIDITPQYPANYDLEGIITVAATDHNDQKASFSNWGATSVDLAAPGVNIYSTLPSNGYGYKSGTSMAAPHVAGAVALLRDAFPNASLVEIKNMILMTVDLVPNMAGKTVGDGRLNLARLLQPLLSTGTVEFDEADYIIGETIQALVIDADLAGAGTVDVTITSDTGDIEVLTLTEFFNGSFVGTIDSTIGLATPGSNLLEVAAGDVITITYNDADDGTGNPVIVTDTAVGIIVIDLFVADFSDASGNPYDEGFTVDNTGAPAAGLWHLTTHRGEDPGHTADDSFWFGDEALGTYNVGQTAGRITSPVISVPANAYRAELSFNSFLEAESYPFDVSTVLISENGGPFNAIAVTIPKPTEGFLSFSYDISAYIGSDIQVEFDFDTIDSVSNNYEGWYVDDVTVQLLMVDDSEIGPRVVTISPPSGQVEMDDLGITQIIVEFDELLNPTSANDADNYLFLEAGANGFFEGGLGDDVIIPVTPVYDGVVTVTLAIDVEYEPLATGLYRLILDGSDMGILDLDGNPLNTVTGPGGGSDHIHEFEVYFEFPFGADLYTLNVEAGEKVAIETRTPFDEPASSPLNDLDPALFVIDPMGRTVAVDDNSASDGKNAKAVFTAHETGTYIVGIYAESGTGEYLLEVDFISIVQWANEVLDVSSECTPSPGPWSAAQALGEPDVWIYGDNLNAWCGSVANGTTEWIELGYDTPVYAAGVSIRESWGDGFVTKVELRNASTGGWEKVWSGTDPSVPGDIVDFEVSFAPRTYLVDAVRITTDTDHSRVWEEIDAVALFGITVAPATVGNLVWLDQNENGIQDSGEVGIEGVTVNLLNSNGSPTGLSTITDADGLYSFTVVPGIYMLEFTAPGGSWTLQDVGNDDSLDSDADPTTGRTAAFSLTLGANDSTWDAGLTVAPVFVQWASEVLGVSSEYTSSFGPWSAAQALGEPDVSSYEDDPHAWCGSVANGTTEWIELGYDKPVYATEVRIRENWGNVRGHRLPPAV